MTTPSPRSPGFHLWHAALAWRAAVQEALGERLTATQFFVLGSIVFLGRSEAPTQAAVFNALATPTGLRHRFPVRFGHYDGGLANARRHAQFEAAAEAFLDPAEPCTAPTSADGRGAP